MAVSKLWLLPLVFAAIGFLYTTRRFVGFMNQRSPLTGLLIYYGAVTLTVVLLQCSGLVVNGKSMDGPLTTVGIVLIAFSFFIIFNQTSCYVNEVTTGGCDPNKVTPILFQSEDGAVYYLWSKAFPGEKHLHTRRVLTYVVTPLLLTLLGVLLIGPGGQVSLSAM